MHIISHNGNAIIAGTPDILPQSGDVLIVRVPFRTLGGISYYPGDTLELIKRTDEAPFYYRSSLGNWLVKCKAKTSVWSSIESNIFEGWIAPKN